jgi:hypothetical protein
VVLKSIAPTMPVCLIIGLPSDRISPATLHNRTVPSTLPDTTCSLSLLKSMAVMVLPSGGVWLIDSPLPDALLKGRRLTKPLIAAVEGPAIASGTDIRIAGESAKFSISEAK